MSKGHPRVGSRPARSVVAVLVAGLLLALLPQSVAHAVVNLAASATATVSSQNAATGQTAAKAIDGVAQGYPTDYTKEWATAGGKAGSWITLTWAQPVYVTSAKLYDRPNADDRVTAGTLLFSDGASTSTVAVGALTNNGAATTVSFDERKVTSVTFRVDTVATTTHNVGLAEFEVYGTTGQTVNQIPTAVAGNAFSATVNTVVQVNGSGSSDPDGSIASWAWTVVAQPAGSAISLTDGNTSVASFTPSVAVAYPLGLVVTDNSGAPSPRSTVVVTVTAPESTLHSPANAAITLRRLVTHTSGLYAAS